MVRYDGQSIQAEYVAKRMKALSDAAKREEQLMAQIPELVPIIKRISAIGPELLRLAVSGAENFQELSDRLYNEHEALVERKKAILKTNGYPEDYDMPVFECKICADNGVVGNAVCECVKRITSRRAYYGSGLGKALEGQTFESFDIRYYSGTTKNGYSVKELMTDVLEHCKEYAEKFVPGAESLLMIGGAGLGKTHLASSIAHCVLEKGYSVVYESAQNVVNAFESVRFGRDSSVDTEKFNSCELLIIDDLGTEFITPFSVSVFFNLLNYRIINSKSTIVTTNMSLKEIEASYKERIYSRLLGDYTTLAFCGNDIRRIKKDTE